MRRLMMLSALVGLLTMTVAGIANAQAVSCEQFVSAAGNPSQFGAQQFYDFNATPEQQATLDVDSDGFACDDLETGVDNLGETDDDRAAAEASTATAAPASTTTVVLPDTGGASLLVLGAGIALTGGGLLIHKR